MPSSIQTDVRDALKTSLSSVAASVYNSVPESVITPAVVIVPSSPYMESNLINKSAIKLKLNMTVTAIVSYNSNPASLDNLEKLLISILAVLPSGYILGTIDRPSVVQIGAAQYLAADVNVSTYYTQTN
jgi:hypothetical protein